MNGRNRVVSVDTSRLARASRLAAPPAVISVFVTLARFFSEKADLSWAVSFFIGITWLTLIVGVYLGIRLADEERPYAPMFLTLLIFALLSRIPVIMLWWVTRTYGLGTHYDVHEGWLHALGAQFILGPITQVVTGGLSGMAALLVKRRIEAAPV